MLETIRKIHVTVEETHVEADVAVSPPLKTAIVAVVMKNPWIGTPSTTNLRPEIRAICPELGALIGKRLVNALGGPDGVEAYGKTSVVGVDGELEHAAAMVHTLLFGEQIRKCCEGESTLVFTNTRGGPGAPIMVPMVHKGELLTRTHYHTAQAAIADAPRPDEVIVAVAGANRSRPFPRIGDRDMDRRAIEEISRQ